MSNDYIYTINSTDKEHYNRILASLDIPNTEYCIFQVSELTTKCSILILTKNDYFTINGKQYYFITDYTDLSSESFVEIVDDMIANDGYYCELDTASRIHFFAENEFVINDMSYNCKLLFGLHDIETPLYSKYNPDLQPITITITETTTEIVTDETGEEEEITEENTTTITKNVNQEILIDSVGFTLSTPVLFLLSNVGERTFKNNLVNDKNKSYVSTLKTAMRINNSFSANYPIVSGNSDFETIVKSNDLTNISFILVDANLHEINLLSPLYITIHVQPIPDPDHSIYNTLLNREMNEQK